MPKKKEIVVAVMARNGKGKVVPGNSLGGRSFPRLALAFQEMPNLARTASLDPKVVGVFCNGEHIEPKIHKMVM